MPINRIMRSYHRLMRWYWAYVPRDERKYCVERKCFCHLINEVHRSQIR